MPSTVAGKNLRLSEIALDELGEVAHFIAHQQLKSQSGLGREEVAARLRWIVLENPAREPGMPLGWCVRDEQGSVEGCICCAPQKFLFKDKAVTLMMSSSFYVDQHHRGAGVSIFMKFLQLGKRYPLFASSTSAVVAQIWKRVGAFPIGDSDHEMLGVRYWRGVIEESLVRRLGNNSFTRMLTLASTPIFTIARPLQNVHADGELRRIESSQEAAALCANHSPRLTALRDAAYLQWRYFSEVDPTTRLFAFRAPGDASEYMVATNLRQRGYRGQIRAVNILDIFPEPKPRIYSVIANALVCQYRSDADIIVFRCLTHDSQEGLRQMGFVRRRFEAPIAWCFDKCQHLPTREWYSVPADGDMLL